MGQYIGADLTNFENALDAKFYTGTEKFTYHSTTVYFNTTTQDLKTRIEFTLLDTTSKVGYDTVVAERDVTQGSAATRLLYHDIL
jgi:hypothetical protein